MGARMIFSVFSELRIQANYRHQGKEGNHLAEITCKASILFVDPKLLIRGPYLNIVEKWFMLLLLSVNIFPKVNLPALAF